MVAVPETNQKLPPGMVIGPDGKPCKACAGAVAFASGFKKNMKASAAFTAASATNRTTSNSTNSKSTSTSSSYPLPDLTNDSLDCPANTETLGRHTWTFLHSAAAYYPTIPSFLQKTSMNYLLKSLPILYPCSTCADELKDYMKEHPVTDEILSSRNGVEKYLCEVHNEVNGRLGKEMFNCDKVQERWKEGPKDGRCD